MEGGRAGCRRGGRENRERGRGGGGGGRDGRGRVGESERDDGRKEE